MTRKEAIAAAGEALVALNVAVNAAYNAAHATYVTELDRINEEYPQ